MHIKKGMLVKIINGNHKDLEGKVLGVYPKKECLVVEGVNFRKRAMRPTKENPAGGFVEREAPIHISNVMLIHNGHPTRIGFKKLEDGKKIRISKKTNEEIQI